jgi:PKD repeat protein
MGAGPRKYLVPAIIAVVIIGVLAAVILVGIPGMTKPGGVTPGPSPTSPAAFTRAFEGEWQVETTVQPGSVELFRITILPDNTFTATFPEWKSMTMSGILTDGGSILKGNYSDSASGETGTFTLVLIDNSHFSGTWLIQGHTYTMTGQKGTPGSAPTTSVSRPPATQGTTSASSISAGFSPDKISGSVPLTVTFTDRSSGSPSTYYWDFGDGAFSSTKEPVHTYTTSGTFTVKQTVEKNGQTSSKTQVISVSSVPLTANFIASQTSGTAPLHVTFTDTSAGSPTTWIWQLGNGQVSYDRNPEMVYQAQGDYTVVLTVEKGGVQSKKSITIHVNPAQSVTNPVTIAAPVTTAVSTPSGTFEGYWEVSVGSGTEYYIFNAPVGNSIDGTFGGPDFSYATFTGTLSSGGTVVTGTYDDILLDVTGPFKFTLTDANHFSGTLVDSGVTYTVRGTKQTEMI